MSLRPLRPTDTRPLFRPLSAELVTMLRPLKPDEWQRPTIAGAWLVRDVVAHLVDLMFRRLSFHRDAMKPPPPTRAITSDREFVDFINDLNAQWVTAAKRLSPRALTDLAELAGKELADWFEKVPLDAPALFGVSWAGEQTSDGWFDIGREFVELWHHQQQIRMAVGAPLLVDPQYLRPVLEIALRALPHTYRNLEATAGETVVVEVTGPSGGNWTLYREPNRWSLTSGVPPATTTKIRMSDETAWKLLFHAMKPQDAARALQASGRRELVVPVLTARAVIV